MKRFFLIVICFTIIVGCGSNSEKGTEHQQVEREEQSKHLPEEDNKNLVELEVININGVPSFLVQDLFKEIDGNYVYDDLHRSLTMDIENHSFKIVYGIPVVEHNGLYLATDEISLIVEQENVYLPTAFLEVALGLQVQESGQVVSFILREEVLPASTLNIGSITEREWTIEKMVDYLSFLQTPIEGAEVSTIPGHLPGAKRAYRNGYHEGIDWYGYATGQQISTDTPIYAMADGVVVRADHDYEEYPSPLIRNKDLSLTAQLGETPEYIFDRLRGRQVWVQYEKGIMNRFAHLDSIPEDLKVGDKVTSETIIGFVGNSGTSGAVNQDGTQLHLHQDLLIYGELFWKPFSLEETKEIIVQIFSEAK